MTAVAAPSQRHHYKRTDSEHEAQATGSETTITTSSGSMHQQREPAKSVFVYLNGDRFYPGRKFVVNRRQLGNFDGFLTEVTRGINPSFGAIRNIYTPINGHRVEELGQIENNMDLVAGGIEKFRRMGYRDITQRPRMMHSPKKASAAKAPQKNRMQVPGRWRAYVKEPCQIYVYGNGDIIAPAAKLLFTPRQMKSWDLILQHVTEKLGARTGQAARKLYDLNYHLLHDPSQLEAGHYYIAVGSEKLKRLPYGTIPSFNRGHHHISPRRNNAPLPPIKSKSKTRTDDPKPHEPRKPKQGGAKAGASSTSLTRRPHPPPPASEKLEESSVEEIKWWFFKECHKNKGKFVRYDPKQKTAARVEAPPPAAAHQEEQEERESVFHAKPVKVKRSPQPAPDGGEERDTVFRGDVRGVAADEVGEDADTKINVPIDHVPAARVDDEVILSARKDDDNNDSLISASKDENANNISQDLQQRSAESNNNLGAAVGDDEEAEVEEEIVAVGASEDRKPSSPLPSPVSGRSSPVVARSIASPAPRPDTLDTAAATLDSTDRLSPEQQPAASVDQAPAQTPASPADDVPPTSSEKPASPSAGPASPVPSDKALSPVPKEKVSSPVPDGTPVSPTPSDKHLSPVLSERTPAPVTPSPVTEKDEKPASPVPSERTPSPAPAALEQPAASLIASPVPDEAVSPELTEKPATPEPVVEKPSSPVSAPASQEKPATPEPVIEKPSSPISAPVPEEKPVPLEQAAEKPASTASTPVPEDKAATSVAEDEPKSSAGSPVPQEKSATPVPDEERLVSPAETQPLSSEQPAASPVATPSPGEEPILPAVAQEQAFSLNFEDKPVSPVEAPDALVKTQVDTPLSPTKPDSAVSTPVVEERPTSLVPLDKPATSVASDEPPTHIFEEKPASPVPTKTPASPAASEKPSTTVLADKPISPLMTPALKEEPVAPSALESPAAPEKPATPVASEKAVTPLETSDPFQKPASSAVGVSPVSTPEVEAKPLATPNEMKGDVTIESYPVGLDAPSTAGSQSTNGNKSDQQQSTVTATDVSRVEHGINQAVEH